jgi:hypothetical protein
MGLRPRPNLRATNLVAEPPTTKVWPIAGIPIIEEDLHLLVPRNLVLLLVGFSPMVRPFLRILA